MGGSRFWSDMLWNGWIADILVIALFYVGIETRWVEDINYDKHRAIYLDKLTCAPFSLFVYCIDRHVVIFYARYCFWVNAKM